MQKILVLENVNYAQIFAHYVKILLLNVSNVDLDIFCLMELVYQTVPFYKAIIVMLRLKLAPYAKTHVNNALHQKLTVKVVSQENITTIMNALSIVQQVHIL